MKSGDILLGLVACVLGVFLYMVTDVAPAAPTGSASEGALRSALSSGQPVLVEFYADWCGPCRQVGPEVDSLAQEVKGRATVLRFNVDKYPQLSQAYGISGIPAFIAFKKGKEVARQAGGIPKQEMRNMLGM